MQLTDVNQIVFSLSLAGVFVLSIIFAAIVRWASKKKWIGQTAWAVVIGVTYTLLSLIPTFGLEVVAIIFIFFGVAGSPMIIEYLTRIQQEIQKDNEDAKGLAKDLINDRQTQDR
jgi:pyrroloquinoline quinone (PQQ) biosynthesis protein C